jgi:hypothetical protein
MIQRSFGPKTAVAGMAALGIAASPVMAAVGPGNLAAPPGPQAETCANSTNSIQQLATIDNTSDGDFQCLGLSLEGGMVKAIRIETHSFTSDGRRADSEQVKTAEFLLAVVESSHGAVLDGVPGHDAIILKGHFPTPTGKAALVISYLYNGFTGEYRSCPMTLDRVPDVSWRLVNRFDQTVSHIVVKTRRIPVVGMFGIADLEGACTQLDR